VTTTGQVTMPRRMKVCAQPGCPEIIERRHCPTHTTQRERARGSRQQRGYDRGHERLREQWKPKVEAGMVDCHAIVCVMPQRRIWLGMAWDLGHIPDRTAWTGPEHARCNRVAGGHASHPHPA
jgi:hypothetical protein